MERFESLSRALFHFRNGDEKDGVGEETPLIGLSFVIYSFVFIFCDFFSPGHIHIVCIVSIYV